MQTARLTRIDTTDQGTLGELVAGAFGCVTMEPPWKGNAPNVSSIPPGSYPCIWRRSPRYGWGYAVTGVPGRSAILIHPGNIVTHTRGCILPGARFGKLLDHDRVRLAVLLSRKTTRHLAAALNLEPFTLEIT